MYNKFLQTIIIDIVITVIIVFKIEKLNVKQNDFIV